MVGKVSGSSQIGSIIVRSTKDAELIALYLCTVNLEFVRYLLRDLNIPFDKTTEIFEDNSAIVTFNAIIGELVILEPKISWLIYSLNLQ